MLVPNLSEVHSDTDHPCGYPPYTNRIGCSGPVHLAEDKTDNQVRDTDEDRPSDPRPVVSCIHSVCLTCDLPMCDARCQSPPNRMRAARPYFGSKDRPCIAGPVHSRDGPILCKPYTPPARLIIRGDIVEEEWKDSGRVARGRPSFASRWLQGTAMGLFRPDCSAGTRIRCMEMRFHRTPGRRFVYAEKGA